MGVRFPLQYIRTELRSTAKRVRATVASSAAASRAIHEQQGYVEVQAFGIMSYPLHPAGLPVAVPPALSAWRQTEPIRRVRGQELWDAFITLSKPEQEAMVPGGLIFHDWMVSEFTADGVLWLEKHHHWFLASFSPERALASFAVVVRSPRDGYVDP